MMFSRGEVTMSSFANASEANATRFKTLNLDGLMRPYIANSIISLSYNGTYGGKHNAMPEKYRRPHNHERLQAIERIRREWEAHGAH